MGEERGRERGALFIMQYVTCEANKHTTSPVAPLLPGTPSIPSVPFTPR